MFGFELVRFFSPSKRVAGRFARIMRAQAGGGEALLPEMLYIPGEKYLVSMMGPQSKHSILLSSAAIH